MTGGKPRPCEEVNRGVGREQERVGPDTRRFTVEKKKLLEKRTQNGVAYKQPSSSSMWTESQRKVHIG